MTIDILPDLGNAETAFIIGPLFPVELRNMRIDEYLFGTRLIRVFAFVLFILVGEYLAGVHYKKADVAVDLGRGETYPAAVIHGLPHIFDQLGESGGFG